MTKENLFIKTKKIWVNISGYKLKAQEIYRQDNEAFIKLIDKLNLTVDHIIVNTDKILPRR